VSFNRRHGHPEDGETVAPDTKSKTTIIAQGHVEDSIARIKAVLAVQQGSYVFKTYASGLEFFGANNQH
jgi:hypothetical protein